MKVLFEKVIHRLCIALVFLSLLLNCSATGVNDLPSHRVARLIDQAPKSAKVQDAAFEELIKLGKLGVPYIVGHLGDMRPLAKQEIILANRASNSFEGVRHYSPDTMHDALSAILNHITGKSFEFVYNGGTPEQREKNRRSWINWCRSAYPNEAKECEKDK